MSFILSGWKRSMWASLCSQNMCNLDLGKVETGKYDMVVHTSQGLEVQWTNFSVCPELSFPGMQDLPVLQPRQSQANWVVTLIGEAYDLVVSMCFPMFSSLPCMSFGTLWLSSHQQKCEWEWWVGPSLRQLRMSAHPPELPSLSPPQHWKQTFRDGRVDRWMQLKSLHFS